MPKRRHPDGNAPETSKYTGSVRLALKLMNSNDLQGLVRAEWGRWAARERLIDAPVVELAGSHSPFLSRPEELVEAIRGAVTQLEG